MKFDMITSKMSISAFTNSNPPPANPANNILGGYTYNNQPSLSSESSIYFYIDFAIGPYASRDTDWGLGYNLGYGVKQTDPAVIQQADYILDVNDSTYVFLSLNPDWRVVEHNQPDKSQTGAFAKIIVDVAKNSMIYDDGRNTITRSYKFKQPTNITTFNVALLDEYEQIINLEGGGVSMTLEITEVLHSSLYESLRQ